MVALIALGAYLAKSARLIGQMMGESDAVEEVEGNRPEEPDFVPAPLSGRGHDEAQHAGD